VFHGNKTGDLVEKAIEGKTNIILTNACNWQQPTYVDWIEGGADLGELIWKYKPRKVICLGKVAAQMVRYEINGYDEKELPELVLLQHPSFIIRFNRNPTAYIHALKRQVS